MGASQRYLPGWAKLFLGLILPILVAAGCCPGISYTIEMEVTEAGFSRSVVVVSAGNVSPEDGKPPVSTLPENLRARFVALYGPGELVEKGEKFSGSFSEATPDDVGGPGTLLRLTSELGTAFYYHERFGGRFPMLQARKLREQSVDGFFDWLTDWLRRDLESDEEATRIIRFVDGPFRTDAQDLVCLFDTLATHDERRRSNDDPSGVMQIGHFLVDRGYLTAKELSLMIVSYLSDEERKELVIAAVRKRVADGADLSSDSPAMKRLFDDPENTWERFSDYLRTRPEFGELIKRQATSEKQNEIKPDDLIGEQLMPVVLIFFGQALSCGRDLDVKLRTDVEPFSTNGVWDAGEKAVRWSDKRITGKGEKSTEKNANADLAETTDAAVTGSPIILVAGWAVPDEQRQTEWFGETVFEEKELAGYCAWRERLSDEAAAGWRACVDDLRSLPPHARDERLEAFLSALPAPSPDETLLKKVAENLLSNR